MIAEIAEPLADGQGQPVTRGDSATLTGWSRLAGQVSATRTWLRARAGLTRAAGHYFLSTEINSWPLVLASPTALYQLQAHNSLLFVLSSTYAQLAKFQVYL